MSEEDLRYFQLEEKYYKMFGDYPNTMSIQGDINEALEQAIKIKRRIGADIPKGSLI